MGLLDWLTEGLGSLGGPSGADIGGQPPGAPPMVQAPPPPPPTIQQTSAPPPSIMPQTADPTPQASSLDPSATDIGGGMQGAGPQPVPVPAPRPDIPTMATPPQPPQDALPPNATPTSGRLPPAPPMSLAPGGGVNGVGPGLGVAGPPDGFSAPPAGPSFMPDQQGRGGILSRALGLTPDQSNRLAAGLGAGFTAAGNSAGKSPFQALAGGAGATLEGATKEQHINTKEAQGFLDKALAAKKAGDDAAYKTNYMQYLQADLKASQEKAASKDAANKNDSPTQLFLSAQRNVAADPLVKGAMTAYQAALKGGTPDEVAKAKAAYEQTVAERQQAHLAGVGLHPQTAAQIAQQPGMTQANPIDAGTAGITPENIGQKLQPGQYYKNPKDGQIYQFKGSPTTNSATKDVTPAVSRKPKPANPMKPERGTLPSDAEAE